MTRRDTAYSLIKFLSSGTRMLVLGAWPDGSSARVVWVYGSLLPDPPKLNEGPSHPVWQGEGVARWVRVWVVVDPKKLQLVSNLNEHHWQKKHTRFKVGSDLQWPELPVSNRLQQSWTSSIQSSVSQAFGAYRGVDPGKTPISHPQSHRKGLPKWVTIASKTSTS